MNPQNQWSIPVRYIVAMLVVLLALAGLWYIRSVLEPLIVAAFVAYLINPAVNFLIERRGMSRRAAVNVVYFVTLAIFIGVPSTLTPIFFDEFKQVITDLLDLYDQFIVMLMRPNVIPAIPIDFGEFANQLIQFRSTFLSTLPDQLLDFLGKTSLGALWVLVILVAIYYLLAEWPRLRGGFISSFPETYRPELEELYRRVRTIWMSYLRGQILLMFIVGVVFTIAWTAIGVPGALVLGVIAGFLTLIPDVGPFLAAMLAVGVALLEGSRWIPLSNLWVAFIVLAVYGVLMAVKNFWLRPFILGRSVHMHESLVFVSIILATVLWGILGALLIIPVIASLAVIADYLRRRVIGMTPFPDTEPFSAPEAPAPRLARGLRKAAAKSRAGKAKE